MERVVLLLSLVLNIILFILVFFKNALNEILKKQWEEKNKYTKRIKELRFSNIYAPLRKLLIDTHITSASCILYPYFRQRIKKFFSFLGQNEYKKAVKCLFDKGVSTSVGVDFGDFPLDSIEKIVKDNISCCDARLVSLLQGVLRLKYELPIEYRRNPRDLCDEEILLINYIFSEYTKLSKVLLK